MSKAVSHQGARIHRSSALESKKRSTGTVVSGVVAAWAGPRAQAIQTRPPGPVRGSKAEDAWVGEKSASRTERGTSIRTASSWRLALPGIPPNSRNPQIPQILKAKLQAGLQKFGNRLPGFRASSLFSFTTNAVQDRRPWGVTIASSRPPSTAPGRFPMFFTLKVPSPGPPERPESSSLPRDIGRWWAGPLLILPTMKGNSGPSNILQNVLCNQLYIRFHRKARCKIVGFEALEGIVCLSAATSGGGGEGFPSETAVYKHRAILGWFPLQRSPRESCPREDAPPAQAGSSERSARSAPGGGRRLH